MAKTKNILARGGIVLFGMIGCTLGAKVTFQPLYSDVRFQPADKLHAGCNNSADIFFSPQGQKVTKFTLVLYYNPDTIEILRILPNTTYGITSSKIEYNRIILDVQNPNFSSITDTTPFFKLFFKSNSIGQKTIVLGTGSEVITANKTYPLTDIFTLDFAQVLECEPDIIPPSINLIYPKNTQERIILDQYFIFDIKDIGKGIDKNSVVIRFDGEQYLYGSDSLKRNGNSLTFYPKTWIPIDKTIDLNISVTDKQSYGGANKTQSIYNFQTATGISFNKDINPILFRQMTQVAKKIGGSTTECAVLADFYAKSDLIYKKSLKSIIQKIGCDLTSADPSLLAYDKNLSTGMDAQQKQYRNVSVFATIGWILFLIAFTLKMHYLVSYKKHKKLYTDSQKFKIKE